MKISFYGFIIALITAQSLTAEISKAQDIKEVQITFGVRNVTLKYALNKLQKESGYNVFYLSPKVTPYRDISIPVETRSVQETLELILQKTSFSYRQEGKTIILLDNKGRRVENTFQSDSQTNLLKQVRGRVTDENGNGLPGVNIVIKGSQRGFITDTDGRFMIDITDENTVLIFSFVGYMTEEIIVGNQTSIDLTMRVDPKNLSELVVVGYGVQKKSDLTGAVASVPMQFVKDQPVRGIADILQGRVPGMTLSRTSGQVGASTKIRIRGANSILGDNEPLYVVDGIIGGSIGSVHDIESIEILKDASATAIYGERASNGVILVTTKRATSSKPQIRVSFNTGFSYQPTRYPDKMNAAEYAEHLNDMSPGTYTEAEIAEFRRNGGTDWMKALTRTGVKNDHYISYSQKVNQVGVYLSARYLDETGTMKNSKIGGNYQIRANIDFKPSDKLSFNFDLRANRNTQQNGTLSTGTSKEDPLFQALIWSPTEPIWDDEENGIYHTHDRFGALWVNPYMRIMEQQTLSKSHGIYTNLVAEYKITNWLTYHVTGFARQSASSSANYDNAWINPTDPTSTRSANESSAWRLINRLDFNKTFQNAHNIAATVVYETEASESWGLNGLGRNMPLPDLAEYYNIGLSNLQTASSSFGKSSRIGYLGRVNYNFKSRYIFTASYRIDGKSGPTDRIEENKYGAFPSFGLAWNITEEPFINDRVFQNLKIRLGWGKTGNPSGFPYTRMVSKNYSFGVGSASLGYAPGTPANPHLRWEETAQTNVGLDFSVMNGRLSGTVDVFNKNTSGLLTRKTLPMYYGYGTNASFTQNLGNITNKGVEASLDFAHTQRKDFTWNTNINASIIRNKVVNLGEQDAFFTGGNAKGFADTELYRVETGLPLGTMWGYEYLGVWKTGEESEAARYGEKPGDPRYRDLNGDGVVDLTNDTRQIGNSNPKLIWGLSNSITYKNFHFNFLFQGMQGQQVLNLMRAAMSQVHPESRTLLLNSPAKDYWTPENQDTQWPNIHSASNRKRFNSSQWIENGSWAKLKYIGLTYNVPQRKDWLSNLSFSVSATEIFTITKYRGFDPEVSGSGDSDLYGGIDSGTVPIPKTVLFSVTFSL